jgi:hypothetical protein
MKMTVLLVLLIATPEFAQQHAPTVNQCRADASVWNAAVMNHNPEFSKSKLSVTELSLRQDEMHDCRSVDPERVGDSASFQRSDTYRLLEALYTNEIAWRASNFINRHGLWQQFLDEDAAGQR